jgi:hypothetical protein
VANGKIFNHKSFNYFVWTPLGRRVNLYIFAFKFTLRSQQPDIVPGGKFAAGVVDTSGNLPQVSTTLAKLVAKFATGVVDTGGAP